MKGIILDFNEQTKKGLIRGVDEGKYEFAFDDWKSQNRKPKAGLEVDFDQSNDMAINVYLIQTSSACDIKDATVETAIKTGNGLLKIMKVLVPIAIVGAVLIALGTYLYYKHEETTKTNEYIAKFENIKKQADTYYANKQYNEALTLYLTIDSIPWRYDSYNFYNSDPDFIISDDFMQSQYDSIGKYRKKQEASYEIEFKILSILRDIGSLKSCYSYAGQLNEANMLVVAPSNANAAGILKIKDECSVKAKY